MAINSFSRRAVAGLILAVTGLTGAAQVSAVPAPQRPIKAGPPDLTLECCRCVGGQGGKALNISSGVAKWTVSSTPTPPPPPPPGGYAGQGPLIAVMPTNMSPQVDPIDIGPNPLPGVWTTIAGANWIKPTGGLPNGHWTYVLKVLVPDCTVPQAVTISGQLAADDMARMYVDGPSGTTQTLVGNPPAHFNGATRSFNAVLNPVTGGFTKPGLYYIRVEMDNLGGAPAGIVLQGSLAGKCSDQLVKSKDGKDGDGGRADGDCRDC